MKNNYYNDALTKIGFAEIEIDDWFESSNDEVVKWKLNFVRRNLSDLYNKLVEIGRYEIRTLQTHENS